MPETEGTTCTSCFTLNPPGAPACIRCNQPLPEGNGPGTPLIVQPGTGVSGPTDWPGAAPPATDQPGAGQSGAGQSGAGQPEAGQAGAVPPAAGQPGGEQAGGGTGGGSGRRGRGAGAGGSGRGGAAPGGPAELAPQGVATPGLEDPDGYLGQAPPAATGLAVPPRGAPGASRSAAAAVQPPGFGMGTADGVPAELAGMSPAEQRRIIRRIAIVGGIVVLLVLAGGGAALWLTRPKYLDTDPVANGIGTALTQRAGETVLVRCEGTPRLRAGETFQCAATDRHGVTRTVKVRVLDTSGRYEWTLG
ncbi:MAG: hypothetical protein V7637_3745 [Mycobacteriales bacterium]